MHHPLTPRALARLASALVLALAAAACTGSGEPAPAPPADDAAAVPGDGAGGSTPAQAPGTTAGGGEAVADDEATRVAEEWITTQPDLADAGQGELVVDRVVSNMGIAHVQYRQEFDGIPVRGAQLTVHVGAEGQVIGSTNGLSSSAPAAGGQEIDEAAAAGVAEKAVEGDPQGEPEIAAVYIESGTELKLAWQVRIHTVEPLADWAVVVDAGSGEVLFVNDAAVDHGGDGTKAADQPPAAPVAFDVAQAGGCDAPGPPAACVFPVDPIFATGDFDLPVERANGTLEGVALQGLDDPVSGRLVGEFAEVGDDLVDDYASDDGVWGEEGRGTLEFEGAMTYYWVDYTQRLVQDLGFDYHADDPVTLVPRDESEENNAFYLFNEDRIHMGVGSDGLNEAEDAQGIIHEYGHALVQAAIPFIGSAEGGAFHEGFSDLVAFFTTLEYRSVDPPCLFAWVEERDCLRRVDGDGVYPEDLVFESHVDGEIYTGAVYDYFVARLGEEGLAIEDCGDRDRNPCDAVRDEVFATALGSMGFLTPNLDLDDAATAFNAADLALSGGANGALIAERFGAHGFDVGGTETIQMDDLPDTGGDEAGGGAAIGLQIEHDYRGDLAVDLRVVDGDGEELCAVEVAEADGADDGDNITGQYDIAGTSCEPFLPPGPDQVWILDVVDTLAEDVGSVVQFVVSDGENQYPAPGLPQRVPDADPSGISIAVGGDDEGAQTEAMGEVGESLGEITAGLLVSHTYVGDLQIQVGVVDVEARELLCSVLVRAADASDASEDIRGTADVSACAAFYPPTEAQPWVLRVLDTADVDEGTIDAFGLQSVGGSEFVVEGPVPIPDNTGEGATLVIDG